MSRSRTLLAFLAGIGSAAACARAELTVYEPFNYPAGTVVGSQGGGSFGFSTPWEPGGFNASVSSNFQAAAGSLQHGQLATSGGRLTTNPTNAIAGITRDFSAPMGAADTTRYLSFLLNPHAPLNAGAFNGFFGLVLETPGEPQLFIGKPGGGALANYVLEDRGGSGQHVSNFLAMPGETALLVLKAQFTSGGADQFTLYVNPPAGAPEPASSSAFKFDANVGTVTGLTIYSTGGFDLDEIRVGSTFADVTPAIPEPTGLLLVSAPVLLIRRRRGNSPE